MTNQKYLEEMKEARKKWMYGNNLDYDKITADENCDLPRIATALEIIAETFIGILEEAKYIGNVLGTLRK